MNKNKKIFLSGHAGLVGSHLLAALTSKGYSNIVTRTKSELNLLDQKAVADFFAKEKPEAVLLCAAKVGGIMANMTQPATFLYDNLQIQNNVIHSSYLAGVEKLLFLGSSCIYPRLCAQPMKEEYLMTGDVEPTNYGYAIAKIAGLKMCQAYNEQYKTNFVTVLPTNLYGPRDNFDPATSHAMAGLIRRLHEAKIQKAEKFILWGDGKARREWLYIDDLIAALVFVFENDAREFMNIGCGYDISILDLAKMIAGIVGYEGEFEHDLSKPNGMPQKLLDVSRINRLGWKSEMALEDGIRKTYEWFLGNVVV